MNAVDKLVRVAGSLYDKNETELADLLDEIIDAHLTAEASTVQAGKCDRYKSGDHFKGREGTGERFDNCVRYQKCMGKSAESAKKICGYIARRKKGGLVDKDIVRSGLSDVATVLEAKGENDLAKRVRSASEEL